MGRTDEHGAPGVKREPAEWQQIADEVRPYVELSGSIFFVEQYQPARVEWYLERCDLRSRNGPLDVPATDENLSRYNTRDTYLRPSSDGVYAGENDLSQVPYYVHVAALGGSVVELQYYFFYPYNGPLPIACKPFSGVVPLFGAHEGDWEGIKVRYDVEKRAIVEIYFAVHGNRGSPVKHSTTGAGDSTHYQIIGKRPVAYSAYHSHATYPDQGEHTRLYGITCDQCSNGKRWDGPARVVSIDRVLLPHGTDYPEPAWLNWVGRWGSTQESATDSWFSNSPDGPKISGTWNTFGKGDWVDWAPNLPLQDPDHDFSPSALVVGTTPVVSCADEGGAVWAIHRPSTWTASRIGALPSGTSKVRLARFAVAGDGIVLALAQVESGSLYFATQAQFGSFDRWGEWYPLPGAEVGAVPRAFEVATDPTGRVHVLVPSKTGTLYDIAQRSADSKSDWLPPLPVAGSASGSGSVVTARREDGTLVAVYSVAGQTWYLTWSDQSGWSQQGEMPSTTSDLLLASLTMDYAGSLFVFALEQPKQNPSGAWEIRYCYEPDPSKPGHWSIWVATELQQPRAAILRAIPEADQTITVLAMEAPGSVRMSRLNRATMGWSPWVPVGKRGVSELGPVFRNQDGRLEAIALGYDDAHRRSVLLNNYESTPHFGT